MIPYWLLFSLVAVGALGSPERRDWRRTASPLFALVGLLLVLMIGLRFEVGVDWFAYARMYSRSAHLSFGDIFTLRTAEPAYGAISWFAQQIGFGVWAVNLVCAAIFTWGLLRLARRQPRPWLALVVAIPFLVIVVGMAYTRQSAALGLFMLALVALEERRPSKAVVLILAASMFHTSALITLPFVAMSYARNRLETGVLIFVATVIGYFTVLAPRVAQYRYGYIDQSYEAQGAVVRLAMNLVPAMIFLAAYRRFEMDPVQKTLWRNMAIVAVATFVLLFFLGSMVVLDRLALYIIPIQLVVLARLPKLFGRSNPSQLMLTVLVIIYSAAVEYIWLNYANNAEAWRPYQSVLTADVF